MATRRARNSRRFWRLVNPVSRPLAGYAPWWILVESTGRRTGKRRLTPFANGPVRQGAIWLISVHGASSALAHNIAADPRVRVKRRGRWHSGRAELLPVSDEHLAWFGAYARSGLRTFGQEPMLLRIEMSDDDRR